MKKIRFQALQTRECRFPGIVAFWNMKLMTSENSTCHDVDVAYSMNAYQGLI